LVLGILAPTDFFNDAAINAAFVNRILRQAPRGRNYIGALQHSKVASVSGCRLPENKARKVKGFPGTLD